MEERNSLFENEKIGKLVGKFAIPCVISMVVAALYNIVDQIFIGWSEAGAFGNAATNIVYPFTVLALGFALMIGDGAAAGYSLRLGEGNSRKAGGSIGNGILLLLALSAILTAAGLLFGENILALFGADPKEEVCYRYATDYYRVICLGIPFYMLGQGLNGSIRASGSPKYAMVCTMSGAVANLILDPVFIFGLHQGVKGAAVATVIGQVITFGMSLVYLLRRKKLTLTTEDFRPSGELMGRIFSVGLASLIVQLSIVAIMAVENNLLAKYGYETYASTGELYGAVTPLAVNGIVMKLFGIVVSVAIGIGLGGQPIIGYNKGAGNTEQVKACVGCITKAVVTVGAVAFLAFELVPDLLIGIFGTDNAPEYTEYARLCIRIFLSGIILTCYIKAASIMLQSMGSSFKSTIVALLRDVIVFIPATVIIASLSHNIVTMLWAALIADAVSAVIAFLLVRKELKMSPSEKA